MSFIKQLYKTFDALKEQKTTPLLVGHRGVGKSEVVYQYSQMLGMNFIDLRLGQGSDAADVLGLGDFGKDDDGNNVSTKFMVPDYLAQCNGKPTLFFLDEINRAPKDLLQSMFQFVNKGEISLNGFKAPEGSFIVAAMNPPTDDYDVLDFDDEAFADRFCQIKFEPTLNDWIDFCRETGLRSQALEFIKAEPKFLEPDLEDFSLTVKPSRRSWKTFMEIEKRSNIDADTLRMISKGLLGTETTISYEKFKEKNKTISGKDVIENYDNVRKLIVEYAHPQKTQADLISNGIDSVVNYLADLDEISKKQHDNFVAFVTDIPDDLSLVALLAVNNKAVKDNNETLMKYRENSFGYNSIFSEDYKDMTAKLLGIDVEMVS